MPTLKPHERRHREWNRYAIRWRWLLDSYEGGDQYRFAVYGTDQAGYPYRNLVRHKREYDPASPTHTYGQGVGSGASSIGLPPTNNDYDLRLVRTPVPTLVREVVTKHLSRIFAKEVRRAGPDPVDSWWADVDGAGTSIDDWMQSEVAPLLDAMGTLDILMDHPPAPDGEAPATLADQRRLGLDRCVAKVVLPHNVVDWSLNPDRTYRTALVREVSGDPDDPLREIEQFRLWTDTGWTLYDEKGNVVRSGSHRFGRVPLVRLMVERRATCEHVGCSIIEAIAERQREVYNRESELILSDTIQAFPLLQGPEDYLGSDGEIPVGAGWLLPKKKTQTGQGATYEGFEVVDFPKGAAESIRLNVRTQKDDVDRLSALAKPAGEQGGGSNTVAQSGVSKAFDQADLVNLLSRLASRLEHAERVMAQLAYTVCTDGGLIEPDAVEVVYPRQYSVYDASELAGMLADFQSSVKESGATPEVETRALGQMVRVMLPGLSDADLEAIDREIEAAVSTAQQHRDAEREAQRESWDMMNQENANATNPPVA